MLPSAQSEVVVRPVRARSPRLEVVRQRGEGLEVVSDEHRMLVAAEADRRRQVRVEVVR